MQKLTVVLFLLNIVSISSVAGSSTIFMSSSHLSSSLVCYFWDVFLHEESLSFFSFIFHSLEYSNKEAYVSM